MKQFIENLSRTVPNLETIKFNLLKTMVFVVGLCTSRLNLFSFSIDSVNQGHDICSLKDGGRVEV